MGWWEAIIMAMKVGMAYEAAEEEQAASNAARYNLEAKQVAAEQDAESTKLWTEYNERQQRRSDKLKRSSMAIRYTKSGVSINDSTAALVLEEQELQDEMAALSIRAKGITEAAKLKSQASFFNVAARREKRSGKSRSRQIHYSTALDNTSMGMESSGAFSSGGGGGDKAVSKQSGTSVSGG